MNTPLHTIPYTVAAWLGDRFITRLTIWAANRYAAEQLAGANLRSSGKAYDTITAVAA
ncbi:hypothetical protein [Spirosoma sordidisoli]|uniref:hypothetical protein n=1 Tax=Spirosoma sordidisoli TaxID=2502893 RepID=UPI0013EE3CC7|nr:hypothetical protein [Spirosoma sordidisoli]